VRFVWLAVATTVALALQTTLARFVVRGDIIVDLVLVVVVYAALTFGPVTGLLTGTCAGLVQDVLSTGIVGIGGLAKTLVGFLAGVAGTRFIVAQAPSRFFVFFAGSLVHALVSIGLYEGLGLRDFHAPYRAVLQQALGNSLVGVVGFQLAEFLPGAAERRRTQKAWPSGGR
jgi:rod shape-determining protein MreD